MPLLCLAGYQTAFSQLAYASKKDSDPFHDIIDAKEYLAKQLYRLSVSHPGKVSHCFKAIVDSTHLTFTCSN